MKWINVTIRITKQTALIDTDYIAGVLVPDFSPPNPTKPPTADWYSLILKNGSWIECEPSNALDQLIQELQAKSSLKRPQEDRLSARLARWFRISH